MTTDASNVEVRKPAASDRSNESFDNHISSAALGDTRMEQRPGLDVKSSKPEDVAARENAMFSGGFDFNQAGNPFDAQSNPLQPKKAAAEAQGNSPESADKPDSKDKPQANDKPDSKNNSEANDKPNPHPDEDGQLTAFEMVLQDPSDKPEDVQPKVDPETAKNVVGIHVRVPGHERRSQESAFPVALDGGTEDPTDGSRTFATAFHGIGDNFDGRKVLINGPEAFKELDGNNDGQLSKEELKANPNLFGSDKDGAGELKFVTDNFDQALAVSREFNPDANGITKDGLREFMQRNTEIKVVTRDGQFPAKLLGGDKRADVAVLEVAGLNPDQEKAFGKNLPLDTEMPKRGDRVNSLGFASGVFTENEGKVNGLAPSIFKNRFSEQQMISSSANSEGGMSGGPLIAMDTGKVVGVNHGTGLGVGRHAPTAKLMAVLNDINEGKLKISRKP